MDFCFLSMHCPFFLPYSVEQNLTLTLVFSLRSCLPGIVRYLQPGDCMKYRRPGDWFVLNLRFRLVQSVHTGSFGLGIVLFFLTLKTWTIFQKGCYWLASTWTVQLVEILEKLVIIDCYKVTLYPTPWLTYLRLTLKLCGSVYSMLNQQKCSWK